MHIFHIITYNNYYITQYTNTRESVYKIDEFNSLPNLKTSLMISLTFLFTLKYLYLNNGACKHLDQSDVRRCGNLQRQSYVQKNSLNR